jgi:hypothetical protein
MARYWKPVIFLTPFRFTPPDHNRHHGDRQPLITPRANNSSDLEIHAIIPYNPNRNNFEDGMSTTRELKNEWQSATRKLIFRRTRLTEATNALKRAEQVERELWDRFQAELAAETTEGP